jgi:hypothetical protein
MLTSIVIHDYRVSCNLLAIGEELGHWVKPQLITWFDHFLLTKYDNKRWIEQFQMSKDAFMHICDQFKPLISKQDMKYRKAIPIAIWVSCAIYKLAQGANILTCNEMLFAIGLSIVVLVLHIVITTINIVLKKLITWLEGNKMQTIMLDFKNVKNA